MRKKEPLLWFPLYVDKWLYGSTREELDAAECAAWIDFLALASKDEGYIRANVGFPYSEARLAGLLGRSVELIHSTIEKCLKKWTKDPAEKPKLTRLEDGTLYVTNWPEYRLSPRHARRFVSAKTDTMSGKAAIREEEKREEEKREEERDGHSVPLSQKKIDETFEEFWAAYPREGRHAKKESRVKFGALVKRGDLQAFIKAFHGYLDFLKSKRVHDNFDQRPMYAKTFLNDRWKEYVGVKYEAAL